MHPAAAPVGMDTGTLLAGAGRATVSLGNTAASVRVRICPGRADGSTVRAAPTTSTALSPLLSLQRNIGRLLLLFPSHSSPPVEHPGADHPSRWAGGRDVVRPLTGRAH